MTVAVTVLLVLSSAPPAASVTVLFGLTTAVLLTTAPPVFGTVTLIVTVNTLPVSRLVMQFTTPAANVQLAVRVLTLALLLVPLLLGGLGWLLERYGLRRVYHLGHGAELLFTFGCSLIALELVQLIWGRAAMPYPLPAVLDQPVVWLQSFGIRFSAYRVFVMAVAVVVLGLLWLAMQRSRTGLVIQAALTHPDAVQSLGHNLPRLFGLVFAGGCALAGLAGVIGGPLLVTEPAMAAALGSMVFVVIVVGGLGSLKGAFLACLLLGLSQNFAATAQATILDGLLYFAWQPSPAWAKSAVLQLSLAQLAPVLPYGLMLLVLLCRPKGLMGRRAD